MNKLTFSLLAGAAGLFVSAAQAGPITNGVLQVDHDRPVVMIQDRHQEPRREERPHDRPAVVIQQDRHSEPRRETHEARPQQHGQPGIGVQVPGVSIGVGGGTHERR